MILQCRGQSLDLSTPKVMGILNLAPDSFYDGGRYTDAEAMLKQAEKMLDEGADIIDIGAMSSRPGAEIISVEQELARLMPAVKRLTGQFPDCIISVDTIHAKTAEEALSAGVHMINDISAGRLDDAMLATVAKRKAPFVIMHMQGLPSNMQQNPQYENVVAEVFDFFTSRIEACAAAGISQIVLDPGFGFGKSVEHNYWLLRELRSFSKFGQPVLAGLSRKSPICKVLKVSPAQALNGTTAANMLALINGANLLRVHDVQEAKEAIAIFNTCYGPVTSPV